MKTSILALGLACSAVIPLAGAESVRDRIDDPCFQVNIQNDEVNTSSVDQNCDRNVSRTVQAGATNEATTRQTGEVNNNAVRQYQYDRSEYFNRMQRH